MTYELAKQLKDAGFPQNEENVDGYIYDDDYENGAYAPTLSELIEACGDGLKDLTRCSGVHVPLDVEWTDGWMTNNIGSPRTYAETYEEAVAKLWLELNQIQI